MVPVNTGRSGVRRLVDVCLFSRFSIFAASLRISSRQCQYTMRDKANLSISSVSRLGWSELCRLEPPSQSTVRSDRRLSRSATPRGLGRAVRPWLAFRLSSSRRARWLPQYCMADFDGSGGENQAQFAKTRTFKSTLPVAITQRICTSCAGALEAPFAGTPFWPSAAPLVPASFTIPGAHRMHDTK